MNIVLADVKSIQPGQVDAVSEKTTTDDNFSHVFDQQLSREEAPSDGAISSQVIETKEVMMEFIEPVSNLEKSHERIDGLRVDGLDGDISADVTGLDSPQITQIIDYKVNPESAAALEQQAGEALPSDGSLLPPAAIEVPRQPGEEQPIVAHGQSVISNQHSMPDQQESTLFQQRTMSTRQQAIPIQQDSIPVHWQSTLMQQPEIQIPLVTNNPVKPVDLKTDVKSNAAHSGDSLLMAKVSVSGALESALASQSDAIPDKPIFGKAVDFQLTNPALNSEIDINNNLFRSHSPASFGSVNQSPQSLPPHLESLPLPNPRDQAALSGGLGDRIQWMVNQKLNTATIRMDPPMLGRLEVHIQVVDDMTNVTINTQHAQTRDLIENASMRLRDYLQENGYENVNVDVSHQQQQQASDQGGVSDDFLTDEKSTGSEPDIKLEADGNRYFSSDSVVDYFA